MRSSQRFLIIQILLVSIVCGLTFSAFRTLAQVGDQERDLRQIERNVRAVDERERSFRIELEKRLTRLETLIEEQQKILWIVIGALAIQIVETTFSVIVRGDWRKKHHRLHDSQDH